MFPSPSLHVLYTDANLATPYRQGIEKCQAQGKTILLSIGGATYTEGGFSSASDAINSANIVWQTFGLKPRIPSSAPFRDAIIDGFDFDLESPVQNMAPFAKCSRELMNSHQGAQTSSRKNFYITAAPQCTFQTRTWVTS